MVREHLTVQPLSRGARTADFSAWVRDYQRGLLAFAQLIAGDRQTGEDLLQTALARAYLKWPKIGAAGHDPAGYVRRIIINENASLWRHAWKRRERSTSTLPEPSVTDEASIDLTWSAVQALAPRQRAAIALRFYADLTVAETATVMGCSQGSVKTHTARAIAKLKQTLSEGGDA